MPDWDPHVRESRQVTPGPMRVGTKLAQVRVQGERVMNCEAEVTEHIAPAAHSVRSHIMGVEAVFAYRFAKDPMGTRATVTATFKGKGLSWFVERVVGKMCEKVDDTMLERIAGALANQMAKSTLADQVVSGSYGSLETRFLGTPTLPPTSTGPSRVFPSPSAAPDSSVVHRLSGPTMTSTSTFR